MYMNFCFSIREGASHLVSDFGKKCNTFNSILSKWHKTHQNFSQNKRKLETIAPAQHYVSLYILECKHLLRQK